LILTTFDNTIVWSWWTNTICQTHSYWHLSVDHYMGDSIVLGCTCKKYYIYHYHNWYSHYSYY
jgi:hypothetical protein